MGKKCSARFNILDKSWYIENILLILKLLIFKFKDSILVES